MTAKKAKRTKSVYGRKSFNFDLLWVRTKLAARTTDIDLKIAASLIPDIERVMRSDGMTANGRGWECYHGRIRLLLNEKLGTHFYNSDIKAALKLMQADGWVYFKRKDPNDKNSFSTWILLRNHDCHIPQHLGYDFLEDVPARIAPTIAECRHCHRQYQYYWPKRGNGYWRLRDVQELQIIQHS